MKHVFCHPLASALNEGDVLTAKGGGRSVTLRVVAVDPDERPKYRGKLIEDMTLEEMSEALAETTALLRNLTAGEPTEK